jgi:undecaprenyl-phosphate 4-deoxy-4-formamido-L-arabinose transferase
MNPSPHAGCPALSVIIPVYNEEAVLAALFERLYPALDALGIAYELIFVDDGSRDRSVAMLRARHALRADVTRIVVLAGNFGQHMAIMAGFERCRGERIVTLDADLQNPPEEIGKLLECMDRGHDFVGGVRQMRRDTLFRRLASRMMNGLRERITDIRITDQGCMLRAYSRDIVESINECREVNTFIPALAYTFAQNPTEVPVKHEERAAGVSKYSLWRLIHLNFDLVTGFSLLPLQLFAMLGILIALGSVGTYVVVMLQRIAAGTPESAWKLLWDRDILQFFLIGMLLFGLGLVGEYVGRIYEQVRHRPRYRVRAVLESNESDAAVSPLPGRSDYREP